MAISPEKERPRVPEGVIERPETPEIPEDLKRETGIEVVETAFKARVKDRGRDLIQTPATRQVTINIPADQGTLVSWAKGPVTSSLTWLANFWLMMIKKALHFGWKIIRRN